MALSIVDHQLADDTHNLYDVCFHDDNIHTLVTHTDFMVDGWISEIERIHRRRLHHLIVGLDVEWRPSNSYQDNPVATLQLCVGRRCLIFQILYASSIPQSLADFLSVSDYTFVGVGIESDAEKLLEDYGLKVGNLADLRDLAVQALGRRDLKNAGLKILAMDVLGREFQKPKRVTLSRWDNQWLTPVQVQYATVDAFVSFELGRVLNASGSN